MDIDRRRLLKLAGSAALGTTVLRAPWVRRAHAAGEGWADLPHGIWGPTYQANKTKILEIHCVGGVSPWETFWVHEDRGRPNFLPIGPTGLTGTVGGMKWHCDGSPVPADETTAFGTDAAGLPVRWGPATKPLWRQDILDRCRLVVLGHDLAPHEAAAPFAITGHTLGSPRLAGTGAAIQHREISLSPELPRYPSSFVLTPPDVFADYTQPAIAAGQHPGSAQPVLLRVGDGTFEDLLERKDATQQADRLLNIYAGQFRDRLKLAGAGEVIRSAGFQSYDIALKYLFDSPRIKELFTGGILKVEHGRFCATIAATEQAQTPNFTRTQLRTAAHLLAKGVRHVAIFDGGIRNYDTHQGGEHLDLTSAGIFRLCSELAAIIRPPGARTDTQDDRIDLNDTMVVINSEFGRTVEADRDAGGRDHWPNGYVAIIIGGPVQARGIAGGLSTAGDPASGGSQPAAFEPGDLRGAMLLAAGIDPFAPQNFAVQDFSPAINTGGEQSIRENLRRLVLGVAA
jgi:Protein of unknown function (DUF1501)